MNQQKVDILHVSDKQVVVRLPCTKYQQSVQSRIQYLPYCNFSLNIVLLDKNATAFDLHGRKN